MTENKTQQRVNWKAVIIFYVLACAISWPFFWWRDINRESWQALAIPNILKTWSYMWGPGIAAIICLILFRKTHPRRITFFGSSIIKSAAFYWVPLLALCIPGLAGEGMNPHLFPLLFGALGFISILGEELGWRGFLQDALQPLSPAKRYVLIGLMWEVWHFTNRTSHGSLLQVVVRVAVFAVVTILLSYIIGRAANHTRSLIVAVTLHSWIDILAEYPNPIVWTIFGCSVLFWTYMLWKWKPERELSPEVLSK